MDVEEYSRVFPTWEIYPRVHYFRNRYLDLHVRFNKIMRALPARFHDKSLMSKLDDINRSLGYFPQVTVIGKEYMAPEQYIVSVEALQKATELPASATGGIHICICHAKVKDVSEIGLKDIDIAVSYLLKSFLHRCSGICIVFIVCETSNEFPQEELDHFRTNLHRNVSEHCKYPTEILIGPPEGHLQSTISGAIESQIIDGFNETFIFLQRFVRKDVRSDLENINILESQTVVGTIQGFLRNGKALVDAKTVSEHVSYFDVILQSLCHQILCAAVPPMAGKHNLPDIICHELLEEIHFETDLQTSISSDTIRHLKRLEENAQELEKMAKEEETSDSLYTKRYNFDFIVYKLQKDMLQVVTSAEKKLSAMNRLTTVIRKMIFEIRGYLKQTTVNVDIAESDQRELTLEDITDKMRMEIMSTGSIYGMGTLYGQLEIHLKMNLEEAKIKEVKDSIDQLIKEHRFPHPYIIKTVNTEPQKFARSFVEQGDKTSSPFPDNNTQWREGTLGCFVKCSEGVIYFVTCAHVVDPHGKKEHEVYIKKQTSNSLFGMSSTRMIIYGNGKELHFTDFAAVRVLPKQLDMCSFHFKDDCGNNKNARLVHESSSELVGSFVFKYGASTGCTKGIIASNSYILEGQTSVEHLVIVEPLPVPSEDIRSILTNNGNDSGPSQQGDFPSVSFDDAQTDREDLDISDVIHTSLNNSGTKSNSFSSSPNGANSSEEYTTEMDDYSVCSKIQTILPRPETGNIYYSRNGETGFVRSLNEISSGALSDISNHDTHLFATPGDSGSIVCKRDLVKNEIVAISMVTAGDFKTNEPLNPGTPDGEKCLSVRMDTVLAKLQERCETDFVLCTAVKTN
ncbi:uncharacterized protein LOC123549665 [Mercenaria mercenaria]|uniref:uncharacterized protein LOC123549665 n=1 Tax=Mercenaria mercenaria TaxID=6596 RepID=UPI00234F9522|nr:uncharacterized protein LOC123549665 [Mercenaria mercenaria]XP_053401073.1 uncharacterized protein LOC123549665 [Mercenaria mercenaria]